MTSSHIHCDAAGHTTHRKLVIHKDLLLSHSTGDTACYNEIDMTVWFVGSYEEIYISDDL